MAPLIAVRGNNDTELWAARLPLTELIRVGNVFVYVIHNLAELDLDPVAAGHTRHRLRSFAPTEDRGGRGRYSVCLIREAPDRDGFKLPISVGEITVSGSAVKARIVDLSGGTADLSGGLHVWNCAPHVSCCDSALPPESTGSSDLLVRVHILRVVRGTRCCRGRCPNCGGELVARPRASLPAN